MKKMIKVEGMSCGHCKKAVEQAVKGLAGVKVAEVDLSAKILTLECDEKIVTDDMLKEAIKEEGFRVG